MWGLRWFFILIITWGVWLTFLGYVSNFILELFKLQKQLSKPQIILIARWAHKWEGDYLGMACKFIEAQMLDKRDINEISFLADSLPTATNKISYCCLGFHKTCDTYWKINSLPQHLNTLKRNWNPAKIIYLSEGWQLFRIIHFFTHVVFFNR